jgi:hypothetical protein
MKGTTAYIYKPHPAAQRLLQHFTIIFFLLLVNNAYAQYQAKASLDSSFVLIGKQVTLTLELKKPAAAPLLWPSLPDSLGSVEVISKGNVDTVSAENGNIILRQAFKVSAYDSGYFVIPPVNFYPSATDTTVIASSNPLLLTVQIMPVDTSKNFMDIKGVREVPFSWREYIYYIIGAIVLINVILFGLYLYFRYKKNKKLPLLFKKAPEIPPHVIALNALKELDAGKHWQNGQYKYYHAAISDIIRTYIEARWNVPAMEQTTDEILSSSLITFIDDAVKQKLTTILRIADLAKFAKLQPLANENEQSMRDAMEFVNATAPVAAVQEKEVKA